MALTSITPVRFHGDMDNATRGLVMMIVGLVMVLVTVVIAFMTEDPLPAALGVIGIVFIGVGARQRRQG